VEVCPGQDRGHAGLMRTCQLPVTADCTCLVCSSLPKGKLVLVLVRTCESRPGPGLCVPCKPPCFQMRRHRRAGM
jgi:hypothetical protein